MTQRFLKLWRSLSAPTFAAGVVLLDLDDGVRGVLGRPRHVLPDGADRAVSLDGAGQGHAPGQGKC